MSVKKAFQVHRIDPLEATLTHSFKMQDIEPDFEYFSDDIIEAVQFLDASPPHSSKYAPPFEMLEPTNTTLVPSIDQAPILELKQLPTHLKYAYLGDNETLPIIAVEFSFREEDKLLRILREHKTVIGWTIADIKGISPSKCMHKILLEDEARLTRDAQRRLNPHMKQVVRDEVLKLLDVGIIYPILDSKWVSPVQAVPKKSGITMVKTEEDELVPTRITTG
jgi:hypothetical protein